MEFCSKDKIFKYSKQAQDNDDKLRQEGETKNQRMARLCLPAMNAVNIDLEFTFECEDDFSDKKLPTLDYKIWQEKDGQINHSYFQKTHKTPFVIMSRSGMSSQQKVQILANEHRHEQKPASRIQ